VFTKWGHPEWRKLDPKRPGRMSSPGAEPDGLLVEGDKREYILELLMREAPPNMEAGAHPARAELVALTGKRKRNLGKKLRKKLKMAKITAVRETRKVKMTQEARSEKGSAVPGKARELRAGGGDPVDKKQGDRGPVLESNVDLRKGVYWISRASIFPRSSLLGAGQLGFWEVGGGGGSTG
jgi:hypothetical protein